MFSNDIFKEFKSVGPCRLNVEVVKKEWHDRARILRYDDSPVEYTLYENSSGQFEESGVKVTISQNEALQLIEDLNLKAYPDPIFQQATIYRS